MIIGISGKMGAGKDTVGSIFQHFSDLDELLENDPNWVKNHEIEPYSLASYEDWLNLRCEPYSWEIRKFADKLKEVVCLITGCTRNQLENPNFKNLEVDRNWSTITYRELLQKLGTEVCRNIHPDFWVNALIKDYVLDSGYNYELEHVNQNTFKVVSEPERYNNGYPNWIITDLRFLNEYNTIKEYTGVVIRVSRGPATKVESNKSVELDGIVYDDVIACRVNKLLEIKQNAYIYEARPIAAEPFTGNHVSETELDSLDFDYHIENDGTMNYLIAQCKEVWDLIKKNNEA